MFKTVLWCRKKSQIRFYNVVGLATIVLKSHAFDVNIQGSLMLSQREGVSDVALRWFRVNLNLLLTLNSGNDQRIFRFYTRLSLFKCTLIDTFMN